MIEGAAQPMSALGFRPARPRAKRASLVDAPLALAIVLSVFGYPITAALSLILGVDTRELSLPYRGLVLLLTLAVLLAAWLNSRRSPVPAIVGFLGAVSVAVLTLRFAHDAVALDLPVSATQGAGEFALFFYCVTILPALALAFPLHARYRNRTFRVLLWTAYVAVGLAVLALVVLNPEVESGARAEAEGLNAITFASIGALLILLIWCVPGKQMSAKGWLLRGSGLVLGLVPMIMGASRGPIICLIGTLALSHLIRRKSWRMPMLLLLASTAAIIASAPDDWLGAATGLDDSFVVAKRFSDIEDQSTAERLVVLGSSWDTFTANPWLGGALVEPVLQSYPHNVVLEALMVGGVLFGAIIIVLMIATSLRAIRLLKRSVEDPLLRFIGMYAIFVLSMSMISGALYRSPDLWAAVAMTFSCVAIRTRRASRRLVGIGESGSSPVPALRKHDK